MTLVNASPLAISGFFTILLGFVTLLVGLFYAKQRKYYLHRILMILAVIVDALFLSLYIIRFLLGDETKFHGPETIRNFVYYPILIIHITLAVVTIVLVFVHLYKTFTNVKWQAKNPYFEKEYRQVHRGFGRITSMIWIISYIGGITVFFLLYIIY